MNFTKAITGKNGYYPIKTMIQFKKDTEKIIAMALAEDLGTGDITTLSVLPENTVSRAVFRAKQEGVICGLFLVEQVFTYLDPSVSFTQLCNEGETVSAGQDIAVVEGNARAILSGERVALNFLQHLSGIATQTSNWVNTIKGTGVKIVDTRKTTPGLRVLEKYAVRTGGGFNHRMNLSDGVLIKDNHIKAAGGIKQAIKAARSYAPQTLKIEVETESLEQVKEALDAGADIIMLDNMSLKDMNAAVKMIKGKAIIEASGNMNQKNLQAVAQTGVDLISMGALTNNVKSLDVSLKF